MTSIPFIHLQQQAEQCVFMYAKFGNFAFVQAFGRFVFLTYYYYYYFRTIKLAHLTKPKDESSTKTCKRVYQYKVNN